VVVADELAAAWGWTPAQIEPHVGGLINKTFVVLRDGRPYAALQQLHPIFGAEVNLDIEAVTRHIAARGLETPRLIRTVDDRAWVVHEERVWRAITWIDGETINAVPSSAWAEEGGRLVGRFHKAVADLTYDYRFTRAGVHDTAAHLAKLRARQQGSDDLEAVALARDVLAAADTLPVMPQVARRHVHGDLKISNMIFRKPPIAAVSLIDLDTVGRGTMAFELGDAMRSWCNPAGEDVTAVKFDLGVFNAAVAGFRAEADALVSEDERRSVIVGLETVCIELAARFAVDVFDASYFGWDPARFPSRRAHNLVRAKGQLALGLDVRKCRDEALDALLTRS
jgi:Ser/Thr protein kinase RdoA (MazF antagonist)